MGLARLLVAFLLLAAANGCASAPPSRMTAGRTPSVAADLDSLAYARAAATPRAAHAQAMIGTRPAGPPPDPVAGATLAAPVVAVPGLAALDGEEPYRLDSGDRLRIVVFGQDGLTNSYLVDPSGAITMPLIKAVTARGLTTDALSRAIADRLRGGFIREPHVAIEVEIYRPFFILGEVTFPGQYAFVPHMTVENAVAIAGGFTPRAYRGEFNLDRPVAGGVQRSNVPLHTLIRPGDTIIVTERWF